VLPINDLIDLFKSSSGSSNIPLILWKISCIVGAFGVGFSLGHFTKQTWKSLLLCMATAGVVGCVITVGLPLLHKHFIDLTGHKVLTGLRWFALYFPACFVIEEVAFRGAIDSHVHQPGDKLPWLSALYISAIWGLWHLPIVGAKEIPVIVAAMLVMSVHMATGVFLSFGWRRSGNLAVPAFVHAFIDAVRNMVR
jgi:membrane protease YdiL (CAAX protease family)